VFSFIGDISGNADAAFRFLDPVPFLLNDGNEEDGADG
jgi:hypothetical protein